MVKPRAPTPLDHSNVRVTQVGLEMELLVLVSRNIEILFRILYSMRHFLTLGWYFNTPPPLPLQTSIRILQLLSIEVLTLLFCKIIVMLKSCDIL